jgi:hypothetical protein
LLNIDHARKAPFPSQTLPPGQGEGNNQVQQTYCAKVSVNCCVIFNGILTGKARGRLILFFAQWRTHQNASVYLFFLLRRAKKPRTIPELEKPSTTPELDDGTLPTITTDDDLLKNGDDNDNDDADDDVEVVPVRNPYLKKPPATKPSERLIVDNGTGLSYTVPSIVDGESSINDIALFIRQTDGLFKDTDFVNRVRGMNFATTNHLTTTQRHIHRMFECLKCHPRLKFLADRVPDPDAPDKIVPRLYLLVRGIPTDARMEVLNTVMCFFGESLYLKSYEGVDFSKLSPEERAKVRTINWSDYCLLGITN